MHPRPNRQASPSTRNAVFDALAVRPCFSTVRLADELGIGPARARATVDARDESGHIRRDDVLAWVLTATGNAELHASNRRVGAWRFLRTPRRRPGARNS